MLFYNNILFFYNSFIHLYNKTFNIMRRTFLLFAVLLLVSGNSITAQTSIVFINPSFEGTPTPHIAPPYWNACLPGCSPDTQPGSWGITLAPTNGSSYLGLVHQPSTGWQEGVSQELYDTLKLGVPYRFYVDLATTNTTLGSISPGPIELQVWGGDGTDTLCNHTELLWRSRNLTNLQWINFAVNITPSADYTYILFLCHSLDTDSSKVHCVLMDNLSAVAEVNEYNADAFNASVYPNPVSNEFSIQIMNSSPVSVSMQLKNLLGEVVMEKTISGKRSTISTKGISNGIYFLELKNRTFVLSKKLVISK
jgi:hypothetical protein